MGLEYLQNFGLTRIGEVLNTEIAQFLRSSLSALMLRVLRIDIWGENFTPICVN